MTARAAVVPLLAVLATSSACLDAPELGGEALYRCESDADCGDWFCWAGGATPSAVSPGVCVSAIRCASLTDPACDDGLDCTVDRCNLVTASCVHEPVEGACYDGERCGCAHLDALEECRVGVCEAGTCTLVDAPEGTPCRESRCDDEATWSGAVCDAAGTCPAASTIVCEAGEDAVPVCVVPARGCQSVPGTSYASLTGSWATVHFEVGGDGTPDASALTWTVVPEGARMTSWLPDGAVDPIGVKTVEVEGGLLRLAGDMETEPTVGPFVGDAAAVGTHGGDDPRIAMSVRRGDAANLRPGRWSLVGIRERLQDGEPLVTERDSFEVVADAGVSACVRLGETLSLPDAPDCLALATGTPGDFQLTSGSERWWGWVDADGQRFVAVRERHQDGWERFGILMGFREDPAPKDHAVGRTYVLHGLRTESGDLGRRWLAMTLDATGAVESAAAWRAGPDGCWTEAAATEVSLVQNEALVTVTFTLDGAIETWRGPIDAVAPDRPLSRATLVPSTTHGVSFLVWWPGAPDQLEPPGCIR